MSDNEMAVLVFAVTGAICWLSAALATCGDNPRRAARMVLLTPIFPIIVCALAGIYAVKGINALFVAAEIGRGGDE